MKTGVVFRSIIVRMLVAFVVAAGVICSAAIAINELVIRQAVQNEAEAKLWSIVNARRDDLQHLMEAAQNDIVQYSRNPTILEAAQAFLNGWRDFDSDRTNHLQKLYIGDSPYPSGEKFKLDAANDGSSYSAAHGRFHSHLRALVYKHGYYDIYLLDLKGNIIYSVFKELDYATDVINGNWPNSGLTKVFEAALQLSNGKTAFSDFERYPPKENTPASFIATPVFDRSGDINAVLAIQLPIDRLNNLMVGSYGLGKTGQTYIVGPDLLMRSSSRFSKSPTFLRTRVDTPVVKDGLKGLSGTTLSISYRENPVIAAYQSIATNGFTWAVVAEQDQAEIFEPLASLRGKLALWSLWAILGMSLLCFLASWLAARSITKRLKDAT